MEAHQSLGKALQLACRSPHPPPPYVRQHLVAAAVVVAAVAVVVVVVVVVVVLSVMLLKLALGHAVLETKMVGLVQQCVACSVVRVSCVSLVVRGGGNALVLRDVFALLPRGL